MKKTNYTKFYKHDKLVFRKRQKKGFANESRKV